MTPPDWTDEAGGGLEGARCRRFVPTRDDDGVVRDDAWFQDAENALPVCNGDFIGTPCPLRRSCLLQSLINNDHHGVWGGMTTPQRKWIRRNVTDKAKWHDYDYLLSVVPPPDHFANYGDEDADQDEEDFLAEQEAEAAKNAAEGR